MDYIYIFLIVLLATFAQGATGFGFAIVTMPLFSLFLSFKECLMLTLILFMMLTLVMTIKLRSEINYKMAFPVIAASILFSILSIYLMDRFSSGILSKIFGIFLVLLSVYLYFMAKKLRIRPTIGNAFLTGSISGFLGGIFSIEGPPLVVYYLFSTKNKFEYNATIQFTFFAAALFRTALNTTIGNITLDIWPSLLAGTAGLLTGMIPGMFVFKKIDTAKLQLFIYIFMAVMGIILLLKS